MLLVVLRQHLQQPALCLLHLLLRQRPVTDDQQIAVRQQCRQAVVGQLTRPGERRQRQRALRQLKRQHLRIVLRLRQSLQPCR